MSLAFVSDRDVAPATFNVLLFGPPKSGKSTAAATAPGPILWLNAEGHGALGFAHKTATERGHAIHEVEIPDGRHGQKITTVLRDVVDHLRAQRDPMPATVVVDTLGKVREGLARELVTPGSSRSIQQWGQVADVVIGFTAALRDLPVNLVLLAHADQVDDAEAGRTVRPLIGGKATEVIPGEVDVVAFTAPLQQNDRVRYVGQLVDGKGRTGLGDRSGGIAAGEPFRDLDLTAWLASYRAALTPTKRTGK